MDELAEIQKIEEDSEILEDMRKKKKKKSFSELINQDKINSQELEEAMAEA